MVVLVVIVVVVGDKAKIKATPCGKKALKIKTRV